MNNIGYILLAIFVFGFLFFITIASVNSQETLIPVTTTSDASWAEVGDKALQPTMNGERLQPAAHQYR